MKILVTGAAGFIGSAVCARLLERGDTVLGLDSLNAYYDPALKRARLAKLLPQANFSFTKLDLAERRPVADWFAAEKPQRVVHLAAQAGVRHSLTNPHAYADANLLGFLNVLEACRHNGVEHLTYASSSSVYGANRRLPYSVEDNVDHPVSLYAASKKANELMAHSYSHLYGLPATGLRFFTVYGPWGRPDQAFFLFTSRILAGKPIDVFNHGKHRRDYTYIDDIVEGVVRVADSKPGPDPVSGAPHRLYNIGNNKPVWLEEVIAGLEEALGRKAEKNYLPAQPGDVLETEADIGSLTRDFGFTPKTSIKEGTRKFVEWYLAHYAHPH